jgi:hypothetical protein
LVKRRSVDADVRCVDALDALGVAAREEEDEPEL